MSTPNSKDVLHLIHLFEQSVERNPDNTALICDNVQLTYQELEEHSNQLANYLIERGIDETHHVGVFLERKAECYIGMLAVLKTGATYVPIEVEYPDDRVNYILEDLPFAAVLTSSLQKWRVGSIQFPNPIVLDEVKDTLALQPTHRPKKHKRNSSELCYIIYTSGSTGKPKGVEIAHHSISHYVSEASKLYQITVADKIYQGFSLSFDASLEEIWMAFANGATLVACTSKDIRSGVGLIEFLHQHQVTVFSTVPTLAATLTPNLPHLRILILGGEACPSHLVESWSRDNLTIMNTYGPTEASVISTYSICEKGKPVTIGKPLPGYEIVILDESLNPVQDGQTGQLCIAGIALARGYVNQPKITDLKFIINPNNTKQRLYLTGDLAFRNKNGDIEFLGRVDDQVKVRGFRVELNEIETIMMEYKGIKQSIVSLKELKQPTLVAYLLLNDQDAFDMGHFKNFLHKRLPYYMLPGVFEIVTSFPLLTSGKVDRKSLPMPQMDFSDEKNYVCPTTDLECSIQQVFEKSLEQAPISIDDDFFHDLGGHSLYAAKIISDLRKITHTENISILDLYQNPTIRKLAEKIANYKVSVKKVEKKPKKSRVSNLMYTLCVTGQFFGCLLQYAIRSWQFLAIVLCYFWFETSGAFNSIGTTIASIILLFAGIPTVSLLIPILLKWVLLGRVKPGAYKLWGSFYWRWWFVERLQKNLFSVDHFAGSPIINLYYRLLGAKIGKNCYIGASHIIAHDLIHIGDNSSIGIDVRLIGHIVEDGWLKIGAINIGNHCFVGARSVVGMNTTMQDNSALDDMSMLPDNSTILKHQFFSGSPAKKAIMPLEHVIHDAVHEDNSGFIKNIGFGLLHYCGLIFSMLVYYGCYFAAFDFITHLYEEPHGILTLIFAIPAGALLFLGLYFFAVGICKKLLINKVKPGIYPVKSLFYVRQWILVKMLDVSEVSVLADTLFFPIILRLWGANIGKRVELGETPHLIPDLITIEEEGFTASEVGIAWPRVHHGLAKFGSVHIGKRAFVGNMSLLPEGSLIGDETLLGCMTITPPNHLAAKSQTGWLGSPAISLPKRELVLGYSEEEKFTPPKSLYVARIAIELIRIIMPTTFILFEIFGMLYALSFLLNHYSVLTTFVGLPIAEVGISLGLTAVFVLLKWILLGKVKPGTRPTWSLFIWKNDIVTYMHSYFIDFHFTNITLGTPFVSILMRALGSKIGKRVYINSPDFAEFDLIHIDDEACINYESIIQTHLYEDRIFKMSTIDIASGCNIGAASIVLYDTLMEKNSTLGNFSLLMKGETLPYGSSWQGVPAQSMAVHATEVLVDEEISDVVSEPIIIEI